MRKNLQVAVTSMTWLRFSRATTTQGPTTTKLFGWFIPANCRTQLNPSKWNSNGFSFVGYYQNSMTTTSYEDVRWPKSRLCLVSKIVWNTNSGVDHGVGSFDSKICRKGQSMFLTPVMSHFFIQNCCRISLQVSHRQGWKTRDKTECKTSFSRRHQAARNRDCRVLT